MARAPRNWPLAEAKAKFSELVQIAEENGPQYISRRGKPVAVLVPIDAYERLQGRKPARDAIGWLLAPEARIDALPVQDRTTYHWRKPPNL